MNYVTDLVISTARCVVWAPSGFLLRITAVKGNYGFGVAEFENLNPHVSFRRVMSRGDMFRIGIWFIRMALRRRLE